MSSSSYDEPPASAVIDVTQAFSPHHGTPRKVKSAVQVRLEGSPRKVATPEQMRDRIDKAAQRKQETDSKKVDKARANLEKALSRAAANKTREKENDQDCAPSDEQVSQMHAELLAVSKRYDELVFGGEPDPITDEELAAVESGGV